MLKAEDTTALEEIKMAVMKQETRKTPEPVCSAARGVKSDHVRQSAQCSPGASSDKLTLTSIGCEAFQSSADRAKNPYKSNAFVATTNVI